MGSGDRSGNRERDRREGEGRLGDLEFTIIDTAGLDEGAKGSLTARMQEQTEAAIGLADALMFVIDARAGLTPNDRAFADFARRADKPVVLVANKSEGKQGDAGAMEAYALGLGEPIQISAEHGEGLSDLYASLRAVRFAEVVVLMMDAQNKFEEQDLRIADLIEREGRALVIAVNKWDLMGRQSSLIAGLRTDADHLLPQVRGMPIVAVSGLMGEGIDRLMSSIEEAYAVWNLSLIHI